MSVLDLAIEYFKGVGPVKAAILNKELNITCGKDLLQLFPYRYVDKTKVLPIGSLTGEEDYVQLKGKFSHPTIQGQGRGKRFTVLCSDGTGSIELIWFQGIKWVQDAINYQEEYVVFGKISEFNRKFNIAHPEMELVTAPTSSSGFLAPMYSVPDKVRNKGLDTKFFRRLLRQLMDRLVPGEVPEILPTHLLEQFRLSDRYTSFKAIHFPVDSDQLTLARNRLKFEELFFLQLKILKYKARRQQQIQGLVFSVVGDSFNKFYGEHLAFSLTEAQKRVIREIRKDMGSGNQMNRLLQGDVGSGKTIVALFAMLIAIGNDYQACLVAPTEILAQQHFTSIEALVKAIGLQVAFLSGSVKGKARKQLLQALESGSIDILIGTHALFEPTVVFNKLGLAIIDEQHRFGVKQRATLWDKTDVAPPHILVMTATPIPRTLAMTVYGDLDISIIDELPPGRKPIRTVHMFENQRLRLFGRMKEEVAKGRQIYVVYPLIEESEKLDLIDLQRGYEAILREFPMPEYQISMVHGRMKSVDKEYEMQRFVKGTAQIMVATTVIEVGVNVPNATMMIIEHAERFGLSQLHQLRGRVGRGGDQSFCILMTSFKLTADSKLRIKTMCESESGFVIAEADLKLRGPGDLEGTQQSGLLGLKLADLTKDGAILAAARESAQRIIDEDPELSMLKYASMKRYLMQLNHDIRDWGEIS